MSNRRIWLIPLAALLLATLACAASPTTPAEPVVERVEVTVEVPVEVPVETIITATPGPPAFNSDPIFTEDFEGGEGDWSVERMLEVGERIWNMERMFNNAAGFTAKDDTLPKRLLSEVAKTGPAKGKANELHKMMPEYYKLRGWTTDGAPTTETRSRLGL